MAEEKKWFEITPWKHLILFSAMVLGMMIDFIYDYLKARIAAKESEGEVEMPKLMWEKLVLRFVLSTVVFSLFWGHYHKEPMSPLVVLLSLQNGFFWKSVLKKG